MALRKPGKGDYSQPKSYRPIALLNTTGKLMELVLARRMSYWMEVYQLIPRDHVGGRKLTGVEDAVHLLMERITSTFKTDKPVASLLMLDVSGAFDNVSHERLLHNLRKRRVPVEVVHWIRGFLSQRTTIIKMPEYSAPSTRTETGIPQGSPLSPILYLFYNADLIESVSRHAQAIGYIDDVGLLVIGTSAEENCEELQRVYPIIAKPWAQQHASVFSPAKFAVHHFTAEKNLAVDAPLELEGAVIKPEQSIRVLGVHLDSHLIFMPHLRKVEATAQKRIGCLKAIAGSTWGLPLSDMRQLYIGAMRPQMIFGSLVWYTPVEGSRTKCLDRKKLQVLTALQKRATAVVTGAFRVAAGQALDIELFLQPIGVYLERTNGVALLRMRRSPIWWHIQASRTHVATAIRYQSPLRRLQIHYGKFFKSVLVDQSPVEIPMEMIYPWIVPPWWEGATTMIAKTKEKAVDYHNYYKILSCSNGVQHVYTDGSGYRGHVGAAAVSKWWNQNIEEQAYMGDNQMSTVYAAELKGIELALNWGLDGYTWPGCKELNVWTDNQAAISAVADPNGCASGQYILRDIVTKIDLLRRKGIKVAVRWIPAHIGVPGNERADKAAKEAATVAPRRLDGLCYLMACQKQILASAAKYHWDWAWSKAQHGGPVRVLNPEPTKETVQSHKGLTKAESAVWVQLRTGKIALRKYLYDIGRADSPKCDRCNVYGSSQTVRHVLLECSALKQYWPDSFKVPCTLKTLLTSAPIAQTVTRFMTRSRLLGQFLACAQS